MGLSPLAINRSVSSNSLTTFDEEANGELEKKEMSLPNAGAVSPTPTKKRRPTLRRSMTMSFFNFTSSNPSSPRPNSSKPTSPTPESQEGAPKFQPSKSIVSPEPSKIVTQPSTPTSPVPAATTPVPDAAVKQPDSPDTPTN